MDTFSPCRRRPPASVRRVDSTPMLMSSRSALDASDIITPDGHIVLTPTRDHSTRLLGDEGVYEEVDSPPNDRSRTTPVHASGFYSKGLSEPLILGEAPMQQFQMTRSYRSEPRPSTTQTRSRLSRRVVRVLHFVASATISMSLLAAVLLRVNAISAVYLLMLCYGVLKSFASGRFVACIIVVSALACAGHIVFAAALEKKHSAEHALRIIGFQHISNTRDAIVYPGLDILVLLCSLIHFFVVLRRLRLPDHEEVFDLFEEAGAQLLQQDRDETRQSRRLANRIHAVEFLATLLLFLTAFSVPAGATAVLYLTLLSLIVSWTVYAKRITVEEFIHGDTRKDFLVGRKVTTMLLVWSFLSILAWYVLLFDDVVSNSLGRHVIKYAGFADFRSGSAQWQYYVYAALLSLLFACLAKLANLHHTFDRLQSNPGQLDQTSRSRLNESSKLHQGGVSAYDVAKRLRELPFRTRVFLYDGGSLLASAAAIAWCVSYPSYGNAPLMGWAFLTLGLYGLVPSGPLVKVLIVYATLLSMTEYAVNLTWDFVDSDFTKYGLKQFQYPFLDLGVHNLCLIIIYASMRTRWRYEAVVKASKSVVPPSPVDGDSSGTLVEERNSLDIIRHMVQLRRTSKAGWKDYLPLWFQDAKQVLLTHLGALVLLTIVAVALSTRESFFQAGYLVLAMLCIIFFKHRQKLWRVLLAYALVVCLAVFVRNVECKDDTRMELIGLECYSETSETWGSLWPTLFTAQLLIILQLVFQLVIYVSNAKDIDERIRTINMSHQNPIFFVSRIAVEIDNLYRVVGGAICYIAVLYIVFRHELIDSGAHTTVIGSIQLIILLIVAGGHLGKFKRAPRSSLRLKVLWSLAMIVEAIILIARYVFHFKDVSDYFEEHVFTKSFMSSRDFGLEKNSTKKSLSGVFVYLAPTAVLIGLMFWQLSSIRREVRSYEFLVAGRSRFMDGVLFWMDTIRKTLIAFSTTALVVVTMSVAIQHVNAVGAAYVLVLVIGRPLSSWQKLWFPLFWVSVIAISTRYVFQLRLFGGVKSADDGYRNVSLGSNAEWFGLERLQVEEPESKTSMWRLNAGPLLVVLMCFLQRMAQYLELSSKKRIVAFTRSQHTSSELSSQRNQDIAGSSDERTPGYGKSASPGPEKSKSGVREQEAISQQPGDLDAFLNHQNARIEEEADFFSHMRDFCIEYASSASVNVVMLLLTASAFAHRDVISIAYLLVVYAMMYALPENVCKVWFLLAAVLSLIIIGEYFLIVWMPPVAGVVKSETWPWENLSESDQRWLALGNQHKWALLADFVALLATYMLPNSHRLRVNNQHVEVTVQNSISRKELGSLSFRRQGTTPEEDDQFALDKAPSHGGIGESDFMRKTRTSAWHSLVYFFILGWLPLTLIVIFVCGATQGGIGSFVYIGSAVFMLYRLDEARIPSSQWIHQLRKFNWMHLFVMVIISAPFVKDDLSRCLVGQSPIDTASAGEVCLSIEDLLGVETTSAPSGIIAIFVLISIQCEMLATPTYRDVCDYIQLEKMQAPARQEEIVRSFYKQRTAQWFKLKKEKSAALQRLKIIVSKLVHKVEELMDIAMGLHYNLPPMAPAKPRVVEYFQNAVTLEWEPPKDSLHKIRFYRITRQQYPSQTLLGDFGDVVEVKGDTTTVKIEGLRPGTSYQFKVAAVSRMGEGPFSVASDPAATYPLNLNGTCTAGWMKYRRENVKRTWLSTWLSWIQPKYLHRYVVLDNRNLVFYKNEETALRHRSKKRRKKIKTAFPWRNVLTLRLSNTKIQFDDVSPMLFCFELIVRQDGNNADIKYVFQADVAGDFNRFLSALAFSVPRYAVDDSILQCLRDKELPIPDLSAPADENDVDEAGSEMSSVTGDESSFGDAEDAEFDEKSRGSWRIPVYRWIYGFQDAALQAETIVYDPDDQVEPTISEIVSVTINAIRSGTALWCYVIMILAFAQQADFLNFLYVGCTFGYLGVESPRPSSHSWLLLLKYTCAIIILRFAFQLPIFCQRLSGTGYYYPSIQPYCGAPKNSVILEEQAIQPSVVFGLYKFDGITLDGVSTIFEGLQWDFYVALAILWHRRELIIRGLWVDSKPPQDTGSQMDSVFGTRRQGNASELSSRDSIDESFNFGGARRVLSKTGGSMVVNSIDAPKPSIVDDPEAIPQGLEVEIAEQVLQELEAEEEQQKAEELAKQVENDDLIDHRRRTTSRPEVSADAINGVTEQIDIDDSNGASRSYYGQQKVTWLERKAPQVHAFFTRVICVPPPQWDKDIHAAISGAKPGRDYFALSLTVMLFAAVFAILFFKQIGDPDPSKSPTAAQVQSSSMVSGYLVLIVFIQLCFIIWDRAAYVVGSLTSKIVLQYSYIVLLHLCLWVLLPQYIGVYFQKRPALVIFYLLHCVYLWIGALQIRYGYPVFRGSRFNYSSESAYHSVREKVFPLAMMAPFLFEMRALLDYVCTKTSLSWQHWVLLEDTASHLFQVKLEMRGRVEEAEVLQGKKRQPFYKKLLSAGVMLLFLLVCLIGPLLLFSSANPSTKANRITTTEVTFGIEDSRGTVNKFYSGIDYNSPDYEGDQIADGAVMQRVTYDTFSRDVWSSSPPNIDRLVSQLKSTEKLSWIMIISFDRPEPATFLSIKITKRVTLTNADREALAPMIQLSNSDKTEEDATPIQVKSILPSLVELTAVDGVRELSKRLRSINVTKHSVQGSSWWSVEPILLTKKATNANDREFCDETTPFCLIAVSDNIVQGLNSLGIGSYGITAVYIFVLVTVGSAVKGFFRGALFQIQYNELPDPDDVLELVEGIYIARGERYVGHLKDEVRIFETLVRVLRSPETLSKVTGTNVIHIPKAKEKIE